MTWKGGQTSNSGQLSDTSGILLKYDHIISMVQSKSTNLLRDGKTGTSVKEPKVFDPQSEQNKTLNSTKRKREK